MVFLKLDLIGSNQPDDPYRVDLPSYGIMADDYAEMWAIVSVGPRDAPPQLPPIGSEDYPLIGSSYVVVHLSTAQLAAWYARLDSRYPPPGAAYRPTFWGTE